MDKDYILSKARENQMDEMEVQIIKKGNGLASLGILVFVLILVVVKMIKNEVWYDVFSLMFVNMAINNLYKGIKLNRRREIIHGICFSVLAVVFLFSAIFNI